MQLSMHRGSLIVAATVAALSFTTHPATALDNMYPNNGWTCYDGDLGAGMYCQTDNKDFSVWSQGNVPSYAKTIIKDTIKAQYGPTDLVVSWPSSGTYSGDSETDLINQSGSLARKYIGMTWCNDAVTSKKCDQHYVRYNSAISEQGKVNGSDVCHETGHSVGLTHGSDAEPSVGDNAAIVGCMAMADVYSLGSNNRKNINNVY